MEAVALSGAMKLLLELLIPVLGAVFGAGLVAGILQTVTAIEDHSIAVISRICGLTLAIMFFAIPLSKQFLGFTLQLWSGAASPP